MYMYICIYIYIHIYIYIYTHICQVPLFRREILQGPGAAPAAVSATLLLSGHHGHGTATWDADFPGKNPVEMVGAMDRNGDFSPKMLVEPIQK